jgi:hypothetical protein
MCSPISLISKCTLWQYCALYYVLSKATSKNWFQHKTDPRPTLLLSDFWAGLAVKHKMKQGAGRLKSERQWECWSKGQRQHTSKDSAFCNCPQQPASLALHHATRVCQQIQLTGPPGLSRSARAETNRLLVRILDWSLTIIIICPLTNHWFASISLKWSSVSCAHFSSSMWLLVIQGVLSVVFLRVLRFSSTP